MCVLPRISPTIIKIENRPDFWSIWRNTVKSMNLHLISGFYPMLESLNKLCNRFIFPLRRKDIITIITGVESIINAKNFFHNSPFNLF